MQEYRRGSPSLRLLGWLMRNFPWAKACVLSESRMREICLSGCVSSEGWHVQPGARPAGVRVRRPVAWIAGWRETKTLKPIDKVSLGEIASQRAVMKVNVEVASKVKRPEGRARNRKGEGNMDGRKLTDTAISLRRGGSDGRLTRTC